MKDLTKRVVEAGLVSKETAKLMEMWGMVDMPNVSGKTEKSLTELVEKIEDLLVEDEEIPELRETALELDRLFQTDRVACYVDVEPTGIRVDTEIVFDRSSRIVFRKSLAGGDRTDPIDLAARPGQVINEGERKWEIFHVEPRFRGTDPVYLVCEVKPRA